MSKREQITGLMECHRIVQEAGQAVDAIAARCNVEATAAIEEMLAGVTAQIAASCAEWGRVVTAIAIPGLGE